MTPTAPSKDTINWPVFLGTSLLIIILAVVAFIWPEPTKDGLQSVVEGVADTFGWFYIVTATIVLIFVLWVAMSRSGRIRLGPDHSIPQFSTFSWASMLFAAGIGVDLLFFSVAEPIAQFYQPPTGPAGDMLAAKQAVVLTLFHYGITGWAMYALMGMAFGYFAYRFSMPLSIRSALYPIFGKRIHGHAGDVVDIAAMIGTVFGVATSLGIGVTQLNYGLHLLVGLPQTLASQIALVVVAVIVATISAVSGVDKGIKRLSELNVLLAMGLMLFVVLTGRTTFFLQALVMNVGDYVSSFTGLTLNTYAFASPTEWLNAWTLFFWAWWIAWAPFVGLFLARVSRGRTLRQFVFGTLLLPFSFILLWVSIFGNAALDLVLHGDTAFGEAALAQPEAGLYLLLSEYPLSTLIMGVATFVGFLLYITSADSAALVMSNFTSSIQDASQDGPPTSRMFWAAATGLLTVSMLVVNGIPALQSATVVMGLPFSFVMYFIMFGLYRALQLERIRTPLRTPPEPAFGRLSPDALPEQAPERTWSQHMSWILSYPTSEEIQAYMLEVCHPALEQAAEQLQASGVQAKATMEPIEGSTLCTSALYVDLSPAESFTYQLYPVKTPKPSYALRLEVAKDSYYRMEVFTRTGSLGYDMAGHSIDHIVEDAMRLYQAHLEFLHRQGAKRWRIAEDATGMQWHQDFDPDGASIRPPASKLRTALTKGPSA